jgi:hypothetical protein
MQRLRQGGNSTRLGKREVLVEFLLSGHLEDGEDNTTNEIGCENGRWYRIGSWSHSMAGFLVMNLRVLLLDS